LSGWTLDRRLSPWLHAMVAALLLVAALSAAALIFVSMPG
jgi:hypothetical protein